MELEALQQIYGEVRALGAQIVVLTPELERYTRALHKKLNLSFDILTDLHVKTAEAFRLVFTLPDYLRDLNSQAVAEFNGLIGKRRIYNFHSIERGDNEEITMNPVKADYFNAYRSLKLTRDTRGVLVAEFNSKGGPFTFTAQDHTEIVDAFYRIAQDRANKIVILTGAGGAFIPGVWWSSLANAARPGVWSQIHDEGVQVLENIANIRVPLIAAIEGRAHVHSEYALLANVIVAAEGATFQDVAHFSAGVAPGDGIFTTWSYRAGAGRAEAFLLNPQPLTARTAYEWGVVAEVVPNGQALSRARELAELYLKAPEVTRRDTRVHFIQPLKERIVREVGYGLSLEGASSADLIKSKRSKGEAVAQKAKSA